MSLDAILSLELMLYKWLSCFLGFSCWQSWHWNSRCHYSYKWNWNEGYSWCLWTSRNARRFTNNAYKGQRSKIYHCQTRALKNINNCIIFLYLKHFAMYFSNTYFYKHFRIYKETGQSNCLINSPHTTHTIFKHSFLAY